MTIVWTVLNVKDNSLVDLALFLTAFTYAKPGRFCAGPCGFAMKLRIVAAPC